MKELLDEAYSSKFVIHPGEKNNVLGFETTLLVAWFETRCCSICFLMLSLSTS